ncbi:MAG: hypothetical protein IJ285_06805 [Clostridia bacterium]|nr:hypothetical protein [Clostridia bacterium]
MKKVIAMVLALATMLSMTAFAAANFETNYPEDAALPTGTTVTGDADSIDVSTGAVKDAYYGILLVKGTELPTEDNTILYINQETATSDAVAFEVLPLMTSVAEGDVLTLYISSNATGANLISVPMIYKADAPAYTLGDVDGNGDIDSDDALAVLLYFAKGLEFADSEGNAIPAEAGNVDGNADVDSDDALAILLYFAKGTEF